MGNEYTLEARHQQVKETGVFPYDVFLVAVTDELFDFPKHPFTSLSLRVLPHGAPRRRIAA